MTGSFKVRIVQPSITQTLSRLEFDPRLHQPFVDEYIVRYRKQFPGQVSLDVAGVHRAYKHTYGLVDINGIYAYGPFKPFRGFSRVDPARGIVYQKTNKRGR